eukprot:4238271-Prymnesium_polylepis.1
MPPYPGRSCGAAFYLLNISSRYRYREPRRQCRTRRAPRCCPCALPTRRCDRPRCKLLQLHPSLDQHTPSHP